MGVEAGPSQNFEGCLLKYFVCLLVKLDEKSIREVHYLLLYFWGTIGLFFLYNKQNTWMFGNMKLFLVLNRIPLHVYTNFIFLHTQVLFPI